MRGSRSCTRLAASQRMGATEVGSSCGRIVPCKGRELFGLADGALRPASANLKVCATWHMRSRNVPRSILGSVKASSIEGDDRTADAMQAEKRENWIVERQRK